MTEAATPPRRSLVREMVAYLLLIVAAEVITMFFHPLWGIIGHAVIMAVLIGRAAQTAEPVYRAFILSLSLVPLIRVIDLGLSLPLLSIPVMWRLVIVYVPLIVAAVVLMRVLRYRWADIGFNLKAVPVQIGVVFSGLLFGWVEYLILRPEPIIASLDLAGFLPVATAAAAQNDGHGSPGDNPN